MATALNGNDGLGVDKMEIGGRSINIDSTSQLDIPEMKPMDFPVPKRIVVRQLDLSAGASGPITWRDPDEAHPCTSLEDVAKMVAAVRPRGGYNPLPEVEAYHRPLDLNLDRPTCFIIRLNPDWPWRFSHAGRKAKGATLGPEVATDQKNYCNLRHVLDDGSEQYEPFEHPKKCRILYFFAKPPTDPVQPFKNAFNLNIELLYPGGPDTEINSIPIVIDPDIRFPGGTP